MKSWLGIDNGCTGSVGILNESGLVEYHKMPTFSDLDYTKKKKNITRIHSKNLMRLLGIKTAGSLASEVCVFMERPMVNPGRWNATVSALRSWEAVLVCVEALGFRREFVDSKQWQSVLLPSGTEKEALKTVSLQIGKRLFPQVDFTGFKDADGLLLSEFCRRTRP